MIYTKSNVMTIPPISVVQQDVLKENMLTINSYLRESYSQAKGHLQNGVSSFNDGVREIYLQTESYFNSMASPINNFLKDHPKLDAEFQQEVMDGPVYNNIIPVEIALQSPMEENY